jgi:integrase
MEEWTEQPKQAEQPKAPATAEAKLFSSLAERWKAARGPALGRSTFKHYCDALRAYVLPTFGDRPYAKITNEEIQVFINKQAERYSPSVLKSTRLVLSFVLGWAKTQRELPDNPAKGIYTPRATGSRSRTRPLVLTLVYLGVRGEYAVGLKPNDLDADNVLHFRRYIYDRQVYPLDKEELFPLDAVVHAELISRLRSLGGNHGWTFRTKAGTPFSVLDNGRKRYLHAAAKAVGVTVGRWHDFRQLDESHRAPRERQPGSDVVTAWS